jgi:autotransporter-associated beta strand protein
MNASAALSRHPRSFVRSLALRTWLACVAAVLVTATPVQAAIYTYTSASGSANWSAGTNWAGGAAPVSGTTTSLVFTGSQAASASVVSNNDSGTFVLSGLTFSGTGPATGTATYSIVGNPLDFTVTGGTATLAVNSAGTVKPALVISNNLAINATQLLVSQQSTSNPFSLTGTISGAGQLAINYASGATGTTTLNASNSFSGGTWIQRGTLLLGTSAVGNSGANSVLGTSGTITMGNGSASASGIRYTGGSITADKGILIAATTGTATLTVAPTADTTLTMSGNVSAANGGAKTISYQNSGSTFLGSYSVSGLITDGTDGSSPVNVVFGGSGKGALTLSNTASTFSGGVSVQGNTASVTYELITAKIGTAGAASPLGSGTTIKIGSSGNTSTNQLTYTGPGETTNKVIDLQGTTNGATINNLSATGTLTFTSNFTASGAGSKQLSLTGTASTFGEIAGSIVDNSVSNQTSIRKGGNATWYLSGSNGFTGLTNVNQGTLIFGPNALTNSGTIQFSSTGILQYASGNTQDISAKIQMVNAAGATINTNGNNVTYATAFGGATSGTLFKSGLGTLTLAPASGSNSWTGGTVVQQGVLNFASLGALGSGTIRVSSGTLQYGSGVTDDISSRFTLTAASNGAIDTNGNNVIFANAVASTGAGNGGLIKSGAGSLTLQSSSTYSLGTSLLAGSLVAGNVGAFGSGTVTVTNGTLDLGGYNVANAITMNGGSLSNASNYTGVLAIGGTSTVGTASLAGSIGTGVTVNAGSTLNGTAVFAGSIAGAGLVGPGSSSAGILSASSLNPAAGGSFAFEFTQAAPDYTQVLNSGNDILKLTGGSPFASSLSSGNAVNIYFTPAAVGLGTLTGGFFTSNAADFASSISGATFNYYVQSNSGTFSYNGQSYQTLAQYDAAKSVTISTVAANGGQVMQMVVIPEPSAIAILAGAGVAAVLLRGRRHHA